MAINEVDAAAIRRRQAIAEMLMSQGAEPLETNQMAGGYVVPVSPLQGIAKIAQQLSGAYIGKKADEQDAEMRQARNDAIGGIDFNSPDAASELAKNGMVREALQLRMQQAKASQGESGTPGQWYIPAGATAFKDPETGIVGYKTKEGAIIPSRAAMTDYQVSMTNPAAIAERNAAKVGQDKYETTDSEGHPIVVPLSKASPDFVDARIPTSPVVSDYINNAMSAESGGNNNAKNPRSSALGKFQFTDGTWQGLMKSNPELGLTPDGRTNPNQSNAAMKIFTLQNSHTLAKNGIEPNGANLYAAHFLGSGGAVNVLKSPNDAPLSAIVDKQAIDANPFLKGMTVADFKQFAANKGTGKAQSPAEKAAAVASAELPIKLAEEEGKANISANKELSVTKAKNDLEIEKAKNEKLAGIKYNAEQSTPLIDEAIALLPNTVSGGLNAKWNDALEAMNVSTDRAKAKSRLDAIGADLTSKVPKAPGAQSDIELKYAQQQAGNLANSNVPWQTRLSAAKYLKERNEKILKGEEVQAPPKDDKEAKLKALRAKHGL